jgi:hypothetical protein
MITSSVMRVKLCSINIATVFALSEKKTVIVGLDLRKPKLFNEFWFYNDVVTTSFNRSKEFKDIVKTIPIFRI